MSGHERARRQVARSAKADLLRKMFPSRPTARAAARRVEEAGRAGPWALQAGPFPRGSNVIGVGFGHKQTTGAGLLDEEAVRVYVRRKKSRSELTRAELVPSDVNGVPTDVIEVGDVVATARPVPCGVSVGHFRITAGTLGCLVRRVGGPAGDRFILSNNHVLANSNQALVGDAILEPGPMDGGAANPPIATLTDFAPLAFSGATNRIDCAIAKLIRVGDVNPSIAGIGPIVAPPMDATLSQSVRKRGRTTGHTVGIIRDVGADITVSYGPMGDAFFLDQIAITGAGGNFSAGGDSGSLIVDAASRRPVGLLFAGGTGVTFANPIALVLERFGVQIV